MGSRVRAFGRVATGCALALVLTSCLKLDMDLEVRADDTIDGSVIFAMNKELLALAGQRPEELLEDAGGFPTDVEGISAEPYEDDRFAGSELRFDGVPLEEFNQAGDADALSIVREGDRFRVSGVLDLSAQPTEVEGGEGLNEAANQALSSAELRIAITFPGDVIAANGDVSGRTVTWEPSFGERLEIEALGNAAAGGPPWLPLAGAAALIAAVAVVAVVLARRRRVEGPADEGGGFVTVGSEGAPQAGPPPPVPAPGGPTVPEPPPTDVPRPAEPPGGTPGPPGVPGARREPGEPVPEEEQQL